MAMIEPLRRLLDELETTLDAGQQQRVHDLHAASLRYEPVPRLPIVMQYPLSDAAVHQPFPHREAWRDPQKMLFNELTAGFDARICCQHLVGDDLPFTVRANLGTVIVASMFGGRVEMLEDNPPWVRPFESREAFGAVLRIDPTDLSAGLCPRLMDFYRSFHDLLAGYPNLRRCVRVVMPDLQGPFDNAELLRGSEIYVDLYEEPEFVEAVLARMGEAQVAVATAVQPLLSDGPDGFCHQHTVALPGAILIRNDSPTNLSAEMYSRHIAPHDRAVLDRLGGGVHFCGKGDHLVPRLLEIPSLTALDLGQPQMNDLETIYRQAAARRVPLIRYRTNEEQIRTGRVCRRFPTGVTLMHQAGSLDEARRLMDEYRARTE